MGGPLEGMGLENRDFSGPEMTTSETHVHKIWRLDFDFDAGKSIGPLDGVGPYNVFSRNMCRAI